MHRVAAKQVAVEAGQVGDGGAGGARHGQAVAHAGGGATLLQCRWRCGDVVGQHGGVGLEAAVGDQHRAGRERAVGGFDAGASSVPHGQPGGPGAAMERAAEGGQPLGQAAQQDVRAAALPVHSRDQAAGRGEHPVLVFLAAGAEELRTFRAQEVDGRGDAFGQGGCQGGLGAAAVHAADRGQDVGGLALRVHEGDVDDAAGQAGVAGVALALALLQHGDLQAAAGGADRGDHAGHAGADDHQIRVHRRLPCVAVVPAASFA